jgi:hypothetical protein
VVRLDSGGRVPGRPSRKNRQPPSPPPVHERPAPADRDKPGGARPAAGGPRLPKRQLVRPPLRADDVLQAKLAAHKPLVAPIDSRTVGRQVALRKAGMPVVVDGHDGPRTRFNWAQATQVQESRRLLLQKTHKGMWKDPLLIAEIERMKHDQVVRGGGIARRIAVKAGVQGAAKGSLRDALTKNAGRITFDAYGRRVRARINIVRPGTFTSHVRMKGPDGKWINVTTGSDDLMLARLAARNVKPQGLGALDGDELLWIWNHDGRDMRRRFTTEMKTKDGDVSIPGRELVRGMQEFARREGQRTRTDGVLDTPSYDAFISAANKQQRRRELKALQDARSFYAQGNAWETAQRATGLPMDFDTAWKKAGSGGTDPASVAAVHTLLAASELALRHAADQRWQEERQRAYDQALLYSAGANPYLRVDYEPGSLGGPDDDFVTVDGSRIPSGRPHQRSPFQGTPYGITPDKGWGN